MAAASVAAAVAAVQQWLVQPGGHQQWNQCNTGSVQLGPAPMTTDLHWPARLQAAADLRCLSPHRSHIRTLPPASHERLASILDLDSREIGQTEVHKHNPRPTLRGSMPDGRWPAPRPWAVRVAIGVPTQSGGFFALAAARAPPFCLQDPECSGGQRRLTSVA